MMLDEIAAWLAGHGIHPLLAGLILGGGVALLLRRRRPRTVGDPPRPGAGTIATQASLADGSEVAIPAAVIAAVQRGNKVAAIKALRAAHPMELIDAKRIVDRLAAR